MSGLVRQIDVGSGQETQRSYNTAEQAAVDAAIAIDAPYQAAVTAEATRINTIRLNARQVALMNALTSRNDINLIAAIPVQYPSLTGDVLKAVVDIALVLAVLAKQ